MPVTPIGGAPQVFTAGDTQIFTANFTGYAPGAWTLDLVLSRDGILLTTVRAITDPVNPLGFQFTIDAPTSAKLVPGVAQWVMLATEVGSGQRITADYGTVQILPNPAQSLPASATQKALVAIDAAILSLVSGTNLTVNINGQLFTKRNLAEMKSMRNELQRRVDAELRALGVSTRGGAQTILTRFV